MKKKKMNKEALEIFKKTLYNKTIGIDPIDLDYIDSIKQKKSKAGMLKEIINAHRYGNAKMPQL